MPILAYVAAVTAWTASLCAYATYVYELGFPDGFVSELMAAERGLAIVFIAVSLTAGLVLVYLGHRHRRAPRRMVTVAVSLYAVFLVGVACTDYGFHLNLTGSGGG